MNLNVSSKIYITGGTGQLGKELRKVLKNNNLNVTILSRHEVPLYKNETFQEFQLGEIPFHNKPHEEITFIHLAHDFYDYKSGKENINYIGQRKIVDSLKKVRKKRIVYFSTPLLKNQAHSVYQEQKVLGELISKEIEHLILRPSFIFSKKGGTNSIFNKLSKFGLPIPLPNNKNKISPISLDAFTDFIYNLIFNEKKKGILILKGEKNMHFKDFLLEYHELKAIWISPSIFNFVISILNLNKSAFFFYQERIIGIVNLVDINEICNDEEFNEII